MNRLTFIILSAVLCLIPFFFFGGIQKATGGGYNDGYSSGRYYRRGPSFLFMSFGNNYGYSRRRSSRGRGYSSGGFRGGGSRSGKYNKQVKADTFKIKFRNNEGTIHKCKKQ